MKFLPWLLFVASAVLVWAVFSMARESEPMTPRQVLEDVRTRLETGDLTRQDAVVLLDDAILRCADKPMPRLLANLHMLRGQVYFGMGGFGRAGEDFETVLEAYSPGDRRAEAKLVDVDIELGRYEEAEARLKHILEERPRDAAAWVRFGRLGRLTAERALRSGFAVIDETLVAEDAEAARASLEAIAARDPDDPARVSRVRDLHGYFGEDDVERVRAVLDLGDEASVSFRQARVATSRSLQNEVGEDSVRLLMELFAGAGRHDLTTQLGVLLLPDGGRKASEETATVMIRSYLELEQYQNARDLAAPWIHKSQTIRTEQFWLLACETLYLARDWTGLGPLAGQMRFRGFQEETTRLANFYQGIALLNIGEQEDSAVYALSRFFAGLDKEVFPKSRAIAYEAKARAQRTLGDPGELESLRGVVEFDPDCAGAIHVRLSRLMLESPNHGTQLPLHHLTMAMAKMPRRTDEFMADWVELGEKEVATSSVNLDAVFERMRESQTWVQTQNNSAYRMWLFGNRYRELGEWVGMNAAGKRSLQLYPGFLPALDQRIEAELQLGNDDLAAELVLQRIDLAGLDDASRAWLERIPAIGRSNEHVLRLMRADPEHTGRRVLARTMIEDGDPDRALAFLTVNRGGAELDDAERELVARTRLALGRTKRALPVLDELLAAHPDSYEFLLLRTRALLDSGEEEQADAAVAALLAHPDVASADLIELVDDLIRDERESAALRVLDALDEVPRLRGGPPLLRRALVHMTRGEEEEAQRCLARADAFDATGQPELARVFLLLAQRDWRGLTREAGRLAATEHRPTALAEAVLAVLREDLDTARELAAGRPTEGADALAWSLLLSACDDFQGVRPEAERQVDEKVARDVERLLRGTADAPRDPREALGLLLALESPGWAPWARARVRALSPEDTGPLWPLYLEALVDAQQGALDHATERLEAVHLIRPEFVAGWDLHEALLARQLGSIDDPQLQRFRLVRAAALADVVGESEDAALAAAADAFVTEGPERALTVARDTVERFPDWAPGHAHLAELLMLTGAHDESFREWAAACLASRPSSNLRYVPKLLATLAASRSTAEPVSNEEVFRTLSALARHLPEDPLIALRLADLEIRMERVDPAEALDRAFARLDRFRNSTDRTLDQLRPRSARRWIEFIAAIDSSKAEEVLEDELLRRPGELELWLLKSRVLRTRGEVDRAVEHCRVLLQMSRDTLVLRDLATLLSESGAWRREVAQVIDELQQRAPGSRLEPDMVAARLRSVLNEPAKPPEHLPGDVRRLWRIRRDVTDLLPTSKLGHLYVSALLRSDDPAERTRARRVIETLLNEQVPDRYERSYFQALLGLTVEAAEPAAAEQGSSSEE